MIVSYSKSIYYNVRLTSRYIKACINQILTKLNAEITSDELFTLDILKCDGPMCQRDLAKLLFKDRANTGKIARSLEEKGYIEINAEQKIKRLVKNLSLTKKGLDILNYVAEKGQPIIESLTKQISEKEYEFIISILTRMRNNLSQVVETQI